MDLQIMPEGQFSNPEPQILFNDLLAKGKDSSRDVLEVGRLAWRSFTCGICVVDPRAL